MTADDNPPPLHDSPKSTSPQPVTSTSMSDAYHGIEGKTWALMSHLFGLIGYIGNGIGSIVGPLVLWLLKKDTIPEVAVHAKEALNFNISVAIYYVVLILLTIISFGLLLILTGPLMVALAIFHCVCIIIASVKAYNGETWRYPLTMRLVK